MEGFYDKHETLGGFKRSVVGEGCTSLRENTLQAMVEKEFYLGLIDKTNNLKT